MLPDRLSFIQVTVFYEHFPRERERTSIVSKDGYSETGSRSKKIKGDSRCKYRAYDLMDQHRSHTQSSGILSPSAG